MTYIFLIIVASSQSMQVQPMQSMEQCQAAIKSIDIAREQTTWSENIPRINNIKCVEVRP